MTRMRFSVRAIPDLGQKSVIAFNFLSLLGHHVEGAMNNTIRRF